MRRDQVFTSGVCRQEKRLITERKEIRRKLYRGAYELAPCGRRRGIRWVVGRAVSPFPILILLLAWPANVEERKQRLRQLKGATWGIIAVV
jgi:hypothetical protein